MFNVSIYECTQVGEVNQGRSELIPNQALHIREILQRSARGQNLAEVQGNNLDYGEDENEDNHDLFDSTDDKLEVLDKLSYYEARLVEMKKAREAQIKAKLEAKGKETKDNAVDEPQPSENA